MFLATHIPPSILWLVFIITALAVVTTSKLISKYVAGISEKTNLGGAFLGAFVLSLVTSIPELINGITTAALGSTTISYGNVIGVNMMTLTVLVTLDIIFIKKGLFKNISKSNILTILFVILFNIILAIALFCKIPLEINLGFTKISGWFLIMFVIYVGFIYYIYKKGDSEDDQDTEASGCDKMTTKEVVIKFIISSVVLISLSVLTANLADQMALPKEQGGYGLGQAVAGALLLSLCTGLPEITSCIQLSKLGQGNIAVGGIVGSHLFNFLIFFVSDFFYTKSTSLNVYFQNPSEMILQQYNSLKTMIIMGICLILLLFLNTFKKKINNKFLYALPCVVIIVIYLTGWFTGILF